MTVAAAVTAVLHEKKLLYSLLSAPCDLRQLRFADTRMSIKDKVRVTVTLTSMPECCPLILQLTYGTPYYSSHWNSCQVIVQTL